MFNNYDKNIIQNDKLFINFINQKNIIRHIKVKMN